MSGTRDAAEGPQGEEPRDEMNEPRWQEAIQDATMILKRDLATGTMEIVGRNGLPGVEVRWTSEECSTMDGCEKHQRIDVTQVVENPAALPKVVELVNAACSDLRRQLSRAFDLGAVETLEGDW